jgi:hypothetical protein
MAIIGERPSAGVRRRGNERVNWRRRSWWDYVRFGLLAPTSLVAELEERVLMIIALGISALSYVAPKFVHDSMGSIGPGVLLICETGTLHMEATA